MATRGTVRRNFSHMLAPMSTVNLKAKLQTPRILWFSMFTTIVIFDVVLTKLREEQRAHEHMPELPHLFLEVFALAAVSLAVVAVVLPRRAFDRALANANFELSDEGGRKVLADPGAAIGTAFVAFQTPFIIGLALSEAIALCGFTAGFLGGSMLAVSAFFFVSAALMASKFPMANSITRGIERVTGATVVL